MSHFANNRVTEKQQADRTAQHKAARRSHHNGAQQRVSVFQRKREETVWLEETIVVY